jgi:basic membrane lipoprotein Med (substrate-binding protein (PBP1-ABC) superfamily)
MQEVGRSGSTEFPNTQFAIIGDASIPALNVTSITFADVQGAFLQDLLRLSK